MATNQPVEAGPKEVKNAQDMWNRFTNLTKWSIIITVVVLALLGLIFINW